MDGCTETGSPAGEQEDRITAGITTHNKPAIVIQRTDKREGFFIA
jgi:hypothetical protein